MDWTLEVVLVPVRDVDRAVEFYRDQVGFRLDHHTTTEQMDIAQLTPPGSGCSIVVGNLPAHREMAPGSLRGLQLVVPDAGRPGRSCCPGAWRSAGSRCSTSGTAARSSASAIPTATPGRCRSCGSAPSGR
ncbi:VOC family protein [Kocuria sp. CNJ-770]|uniref:VOC family protein n=1 Tax=Kocuria sp. CNJ-770 TaxID=1904964 RepID=UPI0035171254